MGWSKKYKRSIDCNNPKGFSQKAHCAGRKKRENVMKLCQHESCAEQANHIFEKAAKKDACYRKVKARYDVWPSAYASGALVKCRKVGAANWGNKSKKEGVNEAGMELNKLKDAIKMFQKKIDKQGRVTNARDEEHLSNLIKLYNQMGGKGIKEGLDDLKALPKDLKKSIKKNREEGLGDKFGKTLDKYNKKRKKNMDALKKLKKEDKAKVLKLLIKRGNNPQDAKSDVEKLYNKVSKMYKNASNSKKAEIISSLSAQMESVEESYDIFSEDEGWGYTMTGLLPEAEYQGRKVKLGKIMQGDVKKFKVYVKNPKGNVVKVNFGQGGKAKGGTMKIRKSNPKARASFRARHNCDNPGPRHKARYWSCRKW